MLGKPQPERRAGRCYIRRVHDPHGGTRQAALGPSLSLSALEKGQVVFWVALGPAGVAGEEASLPALQRMSVRASTQGDSCDNFCPLNLPSEETGSLTLQFNEQSVSRDQQEFFLETE